MNRNRIIVVAIVLLVAWGWAKRLAPSSDRILNGHDPYSSDNFTTTLVTDYPRLPFWCGSLALGLVVVVLYRFVKSHVEHEYGHR